MTDASPRSSAGTLAPWLWAIGSLGWWLASLYATLPLVAAFPDAVRVGLQPLIWGAAAIGGTLAAGRLVFHRWLPVAWWHVAAAACGLILAGLEAAALRDWSVARFGVFDSDYVGPTAGLFALTVASSVASLAVFVAPRRSSLPPLLAVVAATLLSGVVVATNAAGLGDGVGAGSVALALLVAASGGYTLVVAFAAVVVAIRREVPMD
ncbi:MAG TPA: hypothetical protein VKU35_05155 [Candidatus Limnocylindria bacterium]|nr:hypothetical protein [Candidatus Limnocylindria bacterium]